ncbi:pitrilysin family protein [Geminocystis sp. NIES-3709]|uniref:M16 family metallopeptidase n=1 Tax=Geminocystis sp. NIES-3709 TaxID=1617448 RepID=UPI0005FCB05E|nr:pitrilysin family protein [Geminocystis sp. NIES-3709]BAQ65962.1 processing proteinase [Geminocystis sp. NIES-3709]
MKIKLHKISQWLAFSLVTIFLIISSHQGVLADVTRSYKDLQYPPLPEIKLPEYQRYQLKNGMVVYLMEDHQLPLISGSAIVRTGSRFEPSNQVGLAELTGSLMRLGGTKNHPPDQLNTILEQKAASIETSIGDTSGSASFSSLSYDFDMVFPLFAEVLQSPAFDNQQFELQKTGARGAIARRNDNPRDIARREFDKLIYGESSPYARTVEYETLNNISREDLINFYSKYVRPENIILGIVGDFEPEEMKVTIEKTFDNWVVSTSSPNLETTSPQQKNTNGIFIADQPQLTQSNILLGHLGGKLKDANYPTLSVINGVLNGFGGRLYNEIRSRQGLAYSVYGIWSANYDFPGVFIAGGQTKTETTGQFIKSMISEIDRLRRESITEDELNYAKDSILNSFVFQFQNPTQTLSRLMTYEYYGYPADFIFDYQKAIKNTTVSNVLTTAQEYLTPDKIVTLIVGNQDNIKSQLTNLNQPIKTVDISIDKQSNSKL